MILRTALLANCCVCSVNRGVRKLLLNRKIIPINSARWSNVLTEANAQNSARQVWAQSQISAHLCSFALMTPNNYWTQIFALVCASFDRFERKFAVVMIGCDNLCSYLHQIKNVSRAQSNLRSIALNALSETILLDGEHTTQNVRIQFHYIASCTQLHPVRLTLSENDLIWAQIIEPICAQYFVWAMTADWAQLSAILVKMYVYERKLCAQFCLALFCTFATHRYNPSAFSK